MRPSLLFCLIAQFCAFFLSLNNASSDFSDYIASDVFVPAQCDVFAKPGDHLLIEYEVRYANGTVASYLRSPTQLYHILLDQADDFPITSALKGMCKNGTRNIFWEDASKINVQPIFLSAETGLASVTEGVYMDITLVHVTEPEDYKIFDLLRTGNVTGAMDTIENHKGVNALDEWGNSALMTAVQSKRLEIVAALLNTRMPKVNVNLPKSSGYTALMYAVELAQPSIMLALLRKGADPNVAVQQEGSRGNTPLHFACMLEKTKHAEILLEYGAIPDARNQHGQTPLNLIPADAVRSTKLYFKRILDDAIAKQKAALDTVPQESVMRGNEL